MVLHTTQVVVDLVRQAQVVLLVYQERQELVVL
jgi:hypothetical protein